MRTKSLHAPRSTLHALLVVALLGCSSPRVLEVSSHTHTQTIDAADQALFVTDPASRMHYEPLDLPADDQRQEFLVRWRGAGVDLVRFQYQQLNKPDVIQQQTYAPNDTGATTFAIRGEDFRAGGPVSAWRVSLWRGDTLLAEKKSTLW